MAFNTDSTTAFETQPTDMVYSEEGREFATNRGDTSDDVDPRRLMKDPTLNDIRWLYRTTWASTIVDKPVDDAFKNGYEIVDVPEDSDRDYRKILEDANWEEHYNLARKKARRDGFALTYFVLDDSADGPWEDPMDDSIVVEGLNKLKVLTLDDLARYDRSHGTVTPYDDADPLEQLDHEDYEIRPTGIVVDTNPMSETYEEPLGYLVGPDDWFNNFDNVKFIHRNRILHHVVNPEVDGDLDDITYGEYEGDSVLVGPYHLLRGIKKGNWSLAQTIYRYASKMYHVELPNDATPEEFDRAEKQLQNLNVKSEIVTPNGYEVDDFQTDGQLEPREYFDVLFDQVCAATEMTKSVLFGTQSGTVSGSETDIKNYFNKVERLRQRQYEDDMRLFVTRYVRLTDSRSNDSYTANFDVEWAPLFKLTELDNAETITRKMQTLSAAINSFVLTPAEARSIMKEEWAEFDMNVDDDMLSNAEREFIEAINVAEMGSEAALTNPNEQQGFQGSTQQQNGGGRTQGETSDPSDPTADNRLDDALVDAIADRVAAKLTDDS